MKRTIAVAMAVIIAVFSLPISVFASSTDNNTGDIQQFSQRLLAVIREYDKNNSSIADESLALTGDEYEYADDDELMKKLGVNIEKLDDGYVRLTSDVSAVELSDGNSTAVVTKDGLSQTVELNTPSVVNDEGILVSNSVTQALGFDTQTDKSGKTIPPEKAFYPKRLIVKSESEIKDEKAVDCVSGYNDLFIFQYGSVIDAINAYKYYINDSRVEYVEPDYTCVMQADTADLPENKDVFSNISDKIESVIGSAYSFHETALSWVSDYIGFETIKQNIAQRVKATVKVALLDSGVDLDHELLAGRITDTGCNFSTTGQKNSCEDDFGHGTHTAGIIADNTLSNVTIEPYKVLNNEGKGSMSLIAVAVDLAVTNGADIINMSFTGDGDSEVLEEAVNKAVDSGVIVVAAAGNNGQSLDQYSYAPASIEKAITVACVNKYNNVSFFSNYGSVVDIAAPGEDVKSSYLDNTYTLMSGTSMSAPLVTAGAAIIKSVFPDMKSDAIETRLEEYAIKNTGATKKIGAGILYLRYILQEIPVVADPVFSVTTPEFSETFELKLSCPEENSKVIYLLNSDETNVDIGIIKGTQYTKPITISNNTKVTAIAIASGKKPSRIVSINYKRVIVDEDSKYDITDNGEITAYYGTDSIVNVPDIIKGIKVSKIGSNAFKDNITIEKVTLPDAVTTIGNYAFSGCISLDSVYGKNITKVLGGAFQNSTISEFNWDKVELVSSYAFSGCNKLKNVSLTNVKSIEVSAFQNARGLDNVCSDKVESISMYAFRNSDVTSANFPNVTSLGYAAFTNCILLKNVKFENLKNISGEVFKDCINLASVNVPSAVEIGDMTFMNTAIGNANFKNVTKVGYQAFSGADIITYVKLPNAVKVQYNAFENCNALEYAYMPKLISLAKGTFSGCSKLFYLYLPEVIDVQKGAFDGSSIMYLMFEKLQTLQSLPVTLSAVLLPSGLKTVNIPETINADIYGSQGSPAQNFADGRGLDFTPIPAVVFDMPTEYSQADKYIYTVTIGYNCQYQWYISADGTNSNGTPIENADEFYYSPKRADNAPYYYCEITGTDGSFTTTTASPAVKNDLSLRDADFKAYNSAVEQARGFESELYQNYSAVNDALSVDISTYSLAQQDEVNMQTAKILEAISKLQYKPANYALYNDAVKAAGDIDKTLYSNFSVLGDELVIDVSGKNITQQNEVDRQTNNILDAMGKLTYKPADYTALNTALEDVPDDLTAYSDESVAYLNSLLEQVTTGEDITHQQQINMLAASITDAVSNLIVKPVVNEPPTVTLPENLGEISGTETAQANCIDEATTGSTTVSIPKTGGNKPVFIAAAFMIMSIGLALVRKQDND